MDKATKRHLARRGIHRTAPIDCGRTSSEHNKSFFAWFEETVMGFDSDEYRQRFWREAYKTGHIIGPKPYGINEYAAGKGSIAAYFALMGISFFFWIAKREIDRHIHHLRRPSYYETERAKRLAFSEERRKLRKRYTVNDKPSMDAIRDALAHAHESVENMVRLGSLMEDLECYVDNSPYFRPDGSFGGRRGGIRRYLQGEDPELYARYKTLMKYKSLSKKFRQAVGVGDPMSAAHVLPSVEEEFLAMAIDKATKTASESAQAAERQDGAAHTTGPHTKLRESSAGAEFLTNKTGKRISVNAAANGRDDGKLALSGGLQAAVKEAKEIFRRSRELISDCECSVASLMAQLALRLDPDYTPRAPKPPNPREAIDLQKATDLQGNCKAASS